MADFVYNNVPLSFPKADGISPPSGASAANYIYANDWNIVNQSLLDIKGAITAGTYHGLVNSTEGISSAGTVKLRAYLGKLQVSENAGAWVDVSSLTTLPDVGTAGTYQNVTTDTKGRVSSGTNTIVNKGDITVGIGSTNVIGLAVGANGSFLQADSTQTCGLKWGTNPMPYINVLNYGADPTGVNDCYTAFTNAINALYALNISSGVAGTVGHSSNPILFIPKGVYKLSTKVTLTAYIHVVGENAIIKPDTGVDGFVLPYMNQISNVQFIGGRLGIVISTGNVDLNVMKIEDCQFQMQTVAAIYVGGFLPSDGYGYLNSASSQIQITGCKYWNSNTNTNFLRAGSGDSTVIDTCWIEGTNLGIVCYCRGSALTVRNFFGVPSGSNYGTTPAWFDVDYSVSVFNSRFGGENGGITPINCRIPPSGYLPRLTMTDCETYCVYAPIVRFYDIPNVVRISGAAGMLSTTGFYFDNSIPQPTLDAISNGQITIDTDASSNIGFDSTGSATIAAAIYAQTNKIKIPDSNKRIITGIDDYVVGINMDSGGFGPDQGSDANWTITPGTNAWGHYTISATNTAVPAALHYYWSSALTGLSAGQYTAVFNVEIQNHPSTVQIVTATAESTHFLDIGKYALCIPFYRTHTTLTATYSGGSNQIYGVTILSASSANISGTQTLIWNPGSPGTLTYTANGDTVGTPVSIATSGSYTIASGTASKTLTVSVSLPYLPLVGAGATGNITLQLPDVIGIRPSPGVTGTTYIIGNMRVFKGSRTITTENTVVCDDVGLPTYPSGITKTSTTGTYPQWWKGDEIVKKNKYGTLTNRWVCTGAYNGATYDLHGVSRTTNAWVSGHAYTINDMVYQTDALTPQTGYLFVCSAGGTSGGTGPMFGNDTGCSWALVGVLADFEPRQCVINANIVDLPDSTETVSAASRIKLRSFGGVLQLSEAGEAYTRLIKANPASAQTAIAVNIVGVDGGTALTVNGSSAVTGVNAAATFIGGSTSGRAILAQTSTSYEPITAQATGAAIAGHFYADGGGDAVVGEARTTGNGRGVYGSGHGSGTGVVGIGGLTGVGGEFNGGTNSGTGAIATGSPSGGYGISGIGGGGVCGVLATNPANVNATSWGALQITPQSNLMAGGGAGCQSGQMTWNGTDFLVCKINGTWATLSSINPSMWTYAGDNLTVNFDLLNASTLNPTFYIVAVNGLLQIPTTDYTIVAGTPPHIHFVTAPPMSATIIIRALN
jgi:hypothetical protein